MVGGLNGVIDYCEESPKTSFGLKNKLRLVTKILRDNKDSRIGIFPLLAQHGNVCNVMKEVGVSMAYSLITNQVKEYQQRETIRGKIMRELETLKELVLEKMYRKTTLGVNTHPLVGFRNIYANSVGLVLIPDPDHSRSNTKVQMLEFFEIYSPQLVLQTIKNAIYQQPKKISPDELVDWLKLNSPLEDSYEFLTECFDETGKFTDAALLYFLYILKVLY